MIKQDTIARILDASVIEEVIGEFVTLKRRGTNYGACCPFHNEKTPSFYVSPTKGIYKCFGCGKAGNVSKFLMEHESMTYFEALRWLANKYRIEIEEVDNETGRAEQQRRESLFIVNQYAAEYFENNLHEREDGQIIGLSYFKQRGFRTDTIRKFQLGYSLDEWDALLKDAIAKGYQKEFLEELGLVRSRENRSYDFFKGRVMFPIHNLSGKIIAFAGRTLKKDKKIPKYVNSPETEIYVKSRIVYGIYQAKNAIRKQNRCYLVEGYTDVISLHQAGIENVVASSGTALTMEQIRLIKRYTPNITVLYDGDAAGIKAALRGIDLILEADMNVQVVLLPPDEDPDSFVQQNGLSGFETYVEENTKDFIFFKTDLLLKDAGDDPVQRAALIKEIVQTLAKIVDPIKRMLYIQKCSTMLGIDEQIIINQTNRLKRIDYKRKAEKEQYEAQQQHLAEQKLVVDLQQEQAAPVVKRSMSDVRREALERDLIKVLFDFGEKDYTLDYKVTEFIFNEIYDNECVFSVEPFSLIWQEAIQQLESEGQLDLVAFQGHANISISNAIISLMASPYELSDNWEKMHEIIIDDRTLCFKKDVGELVSRFKLHHINQWIQEYQDEMKTFEKSAPNTPETTEKITELQQGILQMLEWKKLLSNELRLVIGSKH